jgi:hypothetical protein
MTFDDYCNSIGLSSTPPSYPDTHKTSKRVSARKKAQTLKRIEQELQAWQDKRDLAYAQYMELLKRGALKEHTRIEKLQVIARGHEDLEATHAARRILARLSEKASNARELETGTE